ncbi:hypothetical protein P3517_19860 [Vibrio parahaemolyticus]|uniref:hypothetical protein n=1 Tax=Vibrio parahaemolyticus TaxID=670 RepID=UPI00111FA68E|nr:hypothetical protein [Vibrio parahaemolyticus]MDF4686330.1 hypothetical protein [Vibrio parahaemolyticus]TOA31305.1 hypothetical protein CGK30_18335 [Vibrio parahaemolyticus]
MAKSHCNYYLAITDEAIVPVKTFDEARALSHGKPGGNVKGFNSYQEAVDAIPEIRKANNKRLKRKAPKRPRNNGIPKVQEDLSYLSKYLPSSGDKKVTVNCHLGKGGTASTISVLDGKTYVTEALKGVAATMQLQLGFHALKCAKAELNNGAGSVEVLGLNITVVNTLTLWAPKWKQQNWVKPNGQPRPNAKLVREMLALYEQIKSKISFGEGMVQKAPVDDDAPF